MHPAVLLFVAACADPHPVATTDTPPNDTHETAASRPDSPDDTSPTVIPGDTSETDVIPPFSFDHLPVLLVDTDGVDVPDGYKIDARMETVYAHEGTLNDLDTAPRAWSGPIGIELHGSSSLGFPKNNYRIEIRDADGASVDLPLVNLPAEDDWVLYGPYTDKTLVRNALAYTLAGRLAQARGRWQPRFQFAEMYLNYRYVGVYAVIERIKTAGSRIDLPEPAATPREGDISGGYIWRVDQHRNDGWDTDLGTPIDYMEPDADSVTSAQIDYMTTWWNAFEAVLASDEFADPAVGYAAWIDVDSWIDQYLVNEIAHNVDGYRLSAYLYKDPDPDGGILHAGPLWDVDLGFGNVDYCDCWNTNGFVMDDLAICDCAEQFPFWWDRLLSDPGFTTRLRCRWEEDRMGDLSDGAMLAIIDELTTQLAEAEPRDQETWNTLGTYVWPNYYIGETWEDEIAWMKAWLLERAAWLDIHLPGTCAR